MIRTALTEPAAIKSMKPEPTFSLTLYATELFKACTAKQGSNDPVAARSRQSNPPNTASGSVSSTGDPPRCSAPNSAPVMTAANASGMFRHNAAKTNPLNISSSQSGASKATITRVRAQRTFDSWAPKLLTMLCLPGSPTSFVQPRVKIRNAIHVAMASSAARFLLTDSGLKPKPCNRTLPSIIRAASSAAPTIAESSTTVEAILSPGDFDETFPPPSAKITPTNPVPIAVIEIARAKAIATIHSGQSQSRCRDAEKALTNEGSHRTATKVSRGRLESELRSRVRASNQR